MRDQPHITVIIPTRERADVFEKSLLSCTTQNYDNLTILVSDNLSQDRTKEIALRSNDPRVKYVNTGRRLSMAHNYEFGLSHVNDGWVTIIGDDDGLLPRSLEKVADIMTSTNVQAIRSDVCLYRWPGLLGTEPGTLAVPLKRGFEVRKSKEWLSRVMSGARRYTNLPMLYSGGFAKASILQEMRARRGHFYHSCIPDIYSAIAIASVIDDYVWSYEPLAIDGVSKHSTGTSLVNPTADRSSVQKFFAEDNIPLHPDIPPDSAGRVPRVHQAWIYESYLQSRFLRNGADEFTQQEQLKVVLASAGNDPASREWGKVFAGHHGLDFDLVSTEAQRRRVLHRLSEASCRLRRVLNTYYVADEQSLPLADVYQASLVAGKIVDIPPGASQILGRLARKALAKVAAN
jgi:glycosyltransferase involved in cell wall biosynthesis